jgi:hypothetical protein
MYVLIVAFGGLSEKNPAAHTAGIANFVGAASLLLFIVVKFSVHRNVLLVLVDTP